MTLDKARVRHFKSSTLWPGHVFSFLDSSRDLILVFSDSGPEIYIFQIDPVLDFILVKGLYCENFQVGPRHGIKTKRWVHL